MINKTNTLKSKLFPKNINFSVHSQETHEIFSLSLSFQPFPSGSYLVRNRNRDLRTIKFEISKDDELIYYYVVATIKTMDGTFVQEGCAPNFQGGFISLCTCKRNMRTFLCPDEWVGKWIAGFSGLKAGGGRNALVYLMRVAHAYPSNAAAWNSKEIPESMKHAKSSCRSRFGDLYEPISEMIDEYSPDHFRKPLIDHVHSQNDEWHKDIDYINRFGRRAALLYGDPEHSFFWDKPTIFFPKSIGIGQRKARLNDLLQSLESFNKS